MRGLELTAYVNRRRINQLSRATAGAATAIAGAATLNQLSGKITTESLVTIAGATYTLVITNSRLRVVDIVQASVCKGTATTGTPIVAEITPANNLLTIVIQNNHASATFNGTLIISYATTRASS